jgi:hypothetical protein
VNPSPRQPFESEHRFEATRIRAAAIYCSDGRFGEQFDDFLHRGLGLPRYDRVGVPGGAACLAGHFAAYREEEAVLEQLRFLMRVHEIERLVLIAHEGCAFYTQWLNISPLTLREQQRGDLIKAARRLERFGRGLHVEAWFAHKHGDRILFEPVDWSAPRPGDWVSWDF